jgi:dipeptidase E
MKFLLTSAGIKNNAIAQALSDLVGKPLTETSLLFIITPSISDPGDKQWIISNLVDFQKYNFKSIDIIDIAGLPEEKWKKRFEEADVICFGGGNEIYLAEVLERVRMKEYLTFLSEDKVYMGISAGSMVAGLFLTNELYPQIFTEEDFGKVTTPPMELYNFCFIPHLNSSFFKFKKDRLESLKDIFTMNVYSTDDETALVVDKDKVEIIGAGDYWIHTI